MSAMFGLFAAGSLLYFFVDGSITWIIIAVAFLVCCRVTSGYNKSDLESQISHKDTTINEQREKIEELKKQAEECDAKLNEISNKVDNTPMTSIEVASCLCGCEYDYNAVFEYLIGVHVAGVTFSNGRRSRQAILRAIKWKDEPFDDEFDVTLRLTDFEGAPAIEVHAGDHQIGFIPKKLLPYLVPRFDSIDGVQDMSIVGGGKADDGDEIPYGAVFTIRVKREDSILKKEE